MRLLVQSLASGRFLVPSLEDGSPEWVVGLREAGGGVLHDADAVLQLVEDHCEPEDRAVVVDLDRLGTADDYEVGPAASALRSGADAAGATSRPIPDGNHGDNELRRNAR
jgi:hypothetical protein